MKAEGRFLVLGSLIGERVVTFVEEIRLVDGFVRNSFINDDEVFFWL